MKALNGVSRATVAGAGARRLEKQEGLTFRERMRKLQPLRAAGWRVLLRLNREAQVDPSIAPPEAPPGYSTPDAAAERTRLRRIVEIHKPQLNEARPSDGLDARRAAVGRMLDLLERQQQQQDRIAARGIWAEGQR